MKIVWNSIFEIGVGIVWFLVYGDIVCVCYSLWGVEGDFDMFKVNVFFEMGRLNYCNLILVVIDGW